MNSFSEEAQLKSLAEKCGYHKKELTDISNFMNNELSHLTQNLKTQLDIVDSDISVINKFVFCSLNVYLLNFNNFHLSGNYQVY